jgi:hypothetical protein
MATLAGKDAAVFLASGAPVAFTNEATTDAGNHITFTITNAAKRYWQDGAASSYLVEKSVNAGGSWSPVAATLYTLQYVGGKVLMLSALNPGDLIRITSQNGSSGYLTFASVAQADSWSLDVSADIQDVTVFGNAWHAKAATLRDASGKFHDFNDMTAGLFNLVGVRCIFLLYVNSGAGTRWEAYGLIKQYSPKASVDAMIEDDVSFELDGALFFIP